jgi:cytochrome c oxidase accessory protein FixG
MAEEIQLFEKKRKIHSRRVWGKYRKLKWAAMITLLGIYYLVPWLRWDRGPGVPDQAILIDMPARRAYFFFIEIWPQEVYFITGILILAAVGLFFVTSLFGRVWCGYACPQTVWTDLFIWVERIVQGDRNARIRLDAQKWIFEKIWKKTLTHIIWLLIGVCTGGAWVFYFNDAPTLFDQLIHLAVPSSTWVWILALTLSTYIMAGFAREQVCKYMCPYARFQSAMFDKDTLIISYDEQRGEPRHKGAIKAEGKGDCIDCGFCEIVCPQGIDIRNGLQMECIACGLCVDACNNVMDKIGLPQGLIRYDTTHHMEHKINKFRILRPRTIYYSLILCFVGALMIYGLATRTSLELHVLHDRNPLFVQLSDGSIRNSYTIKILNKTHQDKHFEIKLSGLDDAKVKTQPESLEVIADSVGEFRVFVSSHKTINRQDINFTVTDKESKTSATTETIFIGAK